MAVSVIPDFEPGDIDIPMFLEEGNLTVITNGINDRGEGNQYVFTARLHKGDLVTLHTADMTVKAPALGATELVGKIIDYPRFVGNKPVGSETGITYNSGTYQRRIATVRVLGAGVYKIDMDVANKAVVPGQSVKTSATTLNKFDLYDATAHNNTRVIQNASANSGASIGVIFGFIGNIA